MVATGSLPLVHLLLLLGVSWRGVHWVKVSVSSSDPLRCVPRGRARQESYPDTTCLGLPHMPMSWGGGRGVNGAAYMAVPCHCFLSVVRILMFWHRCVSSVVVVYVVCAGVLASGDARQRRSRWGGLSSY